MSPRQIGGGFLVSILYRARIEVGFAVFSPV
jgi:hypothetical protein